MKKENCKKNKHVAHDRPEYASERMLICKNPGCSECPGAHRGTVRTNTAVHRRFTTTGSGEKDPNPNQGEPCETPPALHHGAPGHNRPHGGLELSHAFPALPQKGTGTYTDTGGGVYGRNGCYSQSGPSFQQENIGSSSLWGFIGVCACGC